MTRRQPTEKAPSTYKRYEQDSHPDAPAAHGRDYDGRRLTAGPGGTTYSWDA